MPVEPDDVLSRRQLVAFINSLREEHRADPGGWENSDLERFLEALGAWVDDSPGYWENLRRPEPEQPDWTWVALALRAATGYE
ncbi:MAG TPA: hypothetical protein VI300_23080 [Solirubrobacter sp.]